MKIFFRKTYGALWVINLEKSDQLKKSFVCLFIFNQHFQGTVETRLKIRFKSPFIVENFWSNVSFTSPSPQHGRAKQFHYPQLRASFSKIPPCLQPGVGLKYRHFLFFLVRRVGGLLLNCRHHSHRGEYEKNCEVCKSDCKSLQSTKQITLMSTGIPFPRYNGAGVKYSFRFPLD